MAPCSIVLLALGLCLGQEIHAQEGALPRPSISADPGSVIPRGRPVTIVCRGPAGVQDFRLEKEGRSQFWDKENSSPSEREARFLFPSMSEDTAGRYHCLYQKSTWSELSEDLRLVLSREDVTQVPTPVPAQPSASPALLLTKEHLYLLIGVPLALLLCLLLLLLFCLHRQRQRKQGPPGGKGQLQKPQERLGLAVDSLERSPDLATADRLPEKDRETSNSAPAARDPQEVTYAQLDHGALTERAARAGSPLTPEPSTYATVARH
ncbi:leukocyte-associated immunoglobulin-like receptor 1 isoform X3 [Marmota flaviventris]|uniref:leukocyte-associated immunoglobulin-like receptor 1 isoform X3 n=1 Tax=Marmota flaviventris TaxID=93162 RepID=UPI003A8862D8